MGDSDLNSEQFFVRLYGVLIDKFLEYPVVCFTLLAFVYWMLAPAFGWEHSQAFQNYSRKRMAFIRVASSIAIPSAVFVWLIPALQLSARRVILRPTPSCSTFENPSRVTCFVLGQDREQLIYVTSWKNCSNEDPQAALGVTYYVISSWFPATCDHYRTVGRVMFQPEFNTPTFPKHKPSYPLPAGYCVRASGATSADPLEVTFCSVNGTQRSILDRGHISKSDLVEYQFGWYLVSNCVLGVARFFARVLLPSYCDTAYMSSAYVILPQYTRTLLLEATPSETKPSDAKEKSSTTSIDPESSEPVAPSTTQQPGTERSAQPVSDGNSPKNSPSPTRELLNEGPVTDEKASDKKLKGGNSEDEKGHSGMHSEAVKSKHKSEL